MTYAQFVAKYNGKALDYDGAYGAQCVDLAKQYLDDCFGIKPGAWGNACAYWNNTNPQILAKFNKVPNGPTNIPKQGDIMVYQCSTPGSGGAGHIEIFDRKNGAGSFVAFSQNWGGAYAHMVTHSDNYKYVMGWLTPKPTDGGNMAGINDDVSRQIGWHFMGRNGYDGKPNALQAKQGDIYGKELSNAQMSAFFLSAEAREWRDSRLPKLYAERDALKASNANLNTQVTQMTKALSDAQTKLTQANTQLTKQTEVVNQKQAEISSLQDQVADLTKENAELKAQLATCGKGDDTEWLNKFGEALRWLITRLGLK